jgi:ring-1,2-phenylacetyl-CoA epoxidase subunit PaaC
VTGPEQSRVPFVAASPQGMVVAGGLPAHVVYVLRLGDDNLVMAQRLGEWISRGPDLEEDIALANVALDHLGQARALLAHAGALEGMGRTEDDLAMGRAERDVHNLLLVEQPNGDFAHTVARALFLDAYQVELWRVLSGSGDATLGGIAAKALKEARYHLRHSSAWAVRLGDGTALSHARMQAAVDDLWRFTFEPFAADAVDLAAAASGVGVDPEVLRAPWDARIDAVLTEATLERPSDPYQRTGGRQGFHTEHLGHVLTELQWMQRTFPGLDW